MESIFQIKHMCLPLGQELACNHISVLFKNTVPLKRFFNILLFNTLQSCFPLMSLSRCWRDCYWLWLWTTWKAEIFGKTFSCERVYKPWLSDLASSTRHWWQWRIIEHIFLWAAKLARVYLCLKGLYWRVLGFFCLSDGISREEIMLCLFCLLESYQNPDCAACVAG